MRDVTLRLVTAVALACVPACGGQNSQSDVKEPGGTSGRTGRTAALETGANLLQSKAPVEKISMYLNGFHPAKDDPRLQMESHHYCNQMNEEFTQCILFDGNTADAKIHGIEYIISERLYETLPGDERAYWHPHNYEILSGQLRLPGLPDAVEKQALATKINSYGKTWHVWNTGVHGQDADALPFGPAHLAWSFNRDGEAAPGLVEDRDKRLASDSAKARSDRQDLVAGAKPQGGVDALAGRFGAARPIPGVQDNGDVRTRPVPMLHLSDPAAATRKP